jgi:eukaryotic-like serine/threonine-protein kinase
MREPPRRDDLEISAGREGPGSDEPGSHLPRPGSGNESAAGWALSSSVGSLFGGPAVGERPRPQRPSGSGRQRVASYEVEGELGRGAMGVVYVARDQGTGRRVALKLIQGDVDARRLERFRREGELTARLRHPGVVGVHSAGTWEGKPYLAYELVEGARTLDQAFKERELVERVELVRDTALALGAAHDLGITHRDIKPDNILVDGEGRVRVADFGLATAQDLETLTRTGAVVGTPLYMAPEKFVAGGARGPSLDVWSLGVVLYEAICGELPFFAESVPDLVRALMAPPRPPSSLRPETPPDLEAICLRALSHDIGERYAEGNAFAADLDRFLKGDKVEAASPGLPWRELGALTGVAFGFLLAIVLWRFWPDQPLTQLPPPTPSATPTPSAPTFELQLDEPQDHAFSATNRVRVAGIVRSPAKWVEVQIGENVRRLAPGERFAMRAVVAKPGENVIGLTVRDANGASLTRDVPVWQVPEWYAELSAHARPPLPLPAGLSADPQNPRVYVNETDRQEMVYVPPMRGTEVIRLGTPVRVTKGFYIGRYEVTWRQYLSFCDRTGHVAPRRPTFATSDLHPVTRVSWEDSTLYARWAKLRLPSEAEWVYAALGTDGRTYPWGTSLKDTGSRTNVKNAGKHVDRYEYASPVNAFPGGASPFGCEGMSGNVFEWIEDYHESLPKGEEVRVDPKGPEFGTERVTRGGGYDHELGFGKIDDAHRWKDRAMRAMLHKGFRVARDAQ